ncbi:G5 domain-containing protein [Finegoldia magna]|uniref:Uncharacterized protein n=1 Tax=Finegoldia magna (strain ATCC 29328 / DSM 20472 / WAL 2508) TaxID=334413 RepID=B0S4H7_FINM2|nr:G5 domain-containing protein [Finegoldia magna]BAG09168.1 hypothetical protein FMG_P0119 [Finegoldia magna ATCC 29328]
MKNKKMLKVLSTSFILGTILMTSPSFAEIANDDLAPNVGLEISDNIERVPVKATGSDVSSNFLIKNFKISSTDRNPYNPYSKISFELISKSNKPYKAGDYIEIKVLGSTLLRTSFDIVQDGVKIGYVTSRTENIVRSKTDSSYSTDTNVPRILKVVFTDKIVDRNDVKLHINCEISPGLRYSISDYDPDSRTFNYSYKFLIDGQKEVSTNIFNAQATLVYPFGNTYTYNDKDSNGFYKSYLSLSLSNGGEKGGLKKDDLKGEKFTLEIDNGFDISLIKKGDTISSSSSSIYEKDYNSNNPYSVDYSKSDSSGSLKVIDVIQGKYGEPSKIVVEVENSIPVGKKYIYRLSNLSYKKSIDFNKHDGGVSSGELIANDSAFWEYYSTSITNIAINSKDNTGSSTEVKKETKEEKKTEIIKYTTETKQNPKLKKGETKVVQKGVNGTKEIIYKVTYENGKETKREKISEKVVVKPVKEITEVGTKKVIPATEIEDIAKTTKTTKEIIKAKVEYEADKTLEFGKKQEVKKAVDGEKEITTVSQSGKKDVVTEKVIKDKVDGVTKVGNKKVEVETKDGVTTTTTTIYEVEKETGKLVNPKVTTHKSTKIGTIEDVAKTTKTTKGIIKAKVQYEADGTLEFGKQKEVKKPVDGEKEITTVSQSGKKDVVTEKETKKAIDGVTKVGNKKVEVETKDGITTTTTTIYEVEKETGKLVNPKVTTHKSTKIGTIEDVAKTTKTTKGIIKAKVQYEADGTLEFGKQKEVKKPVDGEKEITTVSQAGKKDIVTEKETRKAIDGVTKVGNKKVEVETKDGVTTTTTTIYEVDKETGKLVNPKVTTNKSTKIGTIEDVAKTTKTTKETIKAKVSYEADEILEFGKQKEVKKAVDGEKEITTVSQSGKKDVVTKKVIKDKVDGLTKVGNKKVEVETKDGITTTTTTIYEVEKETGKLVNPKVTTHKSTKIGTIEDVAKKTIPATKIEDIAKKTIPATKIEDIAKKTNKNDEKDNSHEPKKVSHLPKAGVNSEILTLAVGALATIGGISLSKKRRK